MTRFEPEDLVNSYNTGRESLRIKTVALDVSKILCETSKMYGGGTDLIFNI